jgi:hypothetical protein
MPQPLSTVLPTLPPPGFIVYGHEAVQEQRPELLPWIADVLIAWPYLENRLGLALAHLLDTQAHIGIAMYIALQNPLPQFNAMRAAAEHVLEDEDRYVFELLLDLARTASTCRGRVAHGLWGHLPARPDRLVWIDPKGQLRAQAIQVQQWHKEGTGLVYPGFKVEDAMVYTEQDFRDVSGRIRRLFDWFDRFWVMRATQSPKRGELRTQLRDELEAEKSPPPAKANRSSPESPPQSP